MPVNRQFLLDDCGTGNMTISYSTFFSETTNFIKCIGKLETCETAKFWQNQILSHNNACFQCNIAIKNFVLHMYEIRFNDIMDCTVHMFTSWRHPRQKFQKVADKKNPTFVDCWDKFFVNSSWKMLLSSPKACLIMFFKTPLINFYLNSLLMTDPIYLLAKHKKNWTVPNSKYLQTTNSMLLKWRYRSSIGQKTL